MHRKGIYTHFTTTTRVLSVLNVREISLVRYVSCTRGSSLIRVWIYHFEDNEVEEPKKKKTKNNSISILPVKQRANAVLLCLLEWSHCCKRWQTVLAATRWYSHRLLGFFIIFIPFNFLPCFYFTCTMFVVIKSTTHRVY